MSQRRAKGPHVFCGSEPYLHGRCGRFGGDSGGFGQQDPPAAQTTPLRNGGNYAATASPIRPRVLLATKKRAKRPADTRL